MEIVGHPTIDWATLEEVQEAVRSRDIILFELSFMSSYRVMIIEFLSSFTFTPRPDDLPEEEDDP
ncbi:hypothetical protein Hanom_Chr03g00204621 [Helianthus anomalus]